MIKKPELLAPAGNLEKMKMALQMQRMSDLVKVMLPRGC